MRWIDHLLVSCGQFLSRKRTCVGALSFGDEPNLLWLQHVHFNGVELGFEIRKSRVEVYIAMDVQKLLLSKGSYYGCLEDKAVAEKITVGTKTAGFQKKSFHDGNQRLWRHLTFFSNRFKKNWRRLDGLDVLWRNKHSIVGLLFRIQDLLRFFFV